MIKELQNLFENDLVKLLIALAMETRKAVSIDAPEMKINIVPTENSFSINIEYTQEAQHESAQFKDWLNQLPDDIFTGVCDTLGNEKVKQISTCLESGNVESVRSGIIAFKNAVNDYVAFQLNRYKNILKSL